MDRELRRHIKEDEFRTGLEHAAEYARGHGRQLVYAVGGLLVAVAAVWGLTSYQRQKAVRSEDDFHRALEIYNAPVGDVPGARSAGALYRTPQEKYTKAAAAFDGVERGFPSLPAGRRARLYGALCRLELGQTAEARKTLGELAAQRDASALEPTLARLALAGSHVAAGELDKGLEAYKQLVDDASLPISRDYVLMEMGAALEKARRFDEARAAFQRVVDEFPSSAQAAEAARRAERLSTVAAKT